MREVSFYRVPSFAEHVSVSERLAYVIAYDAGLMVLAMQPGEVSDPMTNVMEMASAGSMQEDKQAVRCCIDWRGRNPLCKERDAYL
jgi:hypothetical protein